MGLQVFCVYYLSGIPWSGVCLSGVCLVFHGLNMLSWSQAYNQMQGGRKVQAAEIVEKAIFWKLLALVPGLLFYAV